MIQFKWFSVLHPCCPFSVLSFASSFFFVHAIIAFHFFMIFFVFALRSVYLRRSFKIPCCPLLLHHLVKDFDCPHLPFFNLLLHFCPSLNQLMPCHLFQCLFNDLNQTTSGKHKKKHMQHVSHLFTSLLFFLMLTMTTKR